MIDKLNKDRVYDSPIVTEVSELKNYHIAESYHQNYYQLNKNAPYCQLVIAPKLEKILKF